MTQPSSPNVIPLEVGTRRLWACELSKSLLTLMNSLQGYSSRPLVPGWKPPTQVEIVV